MLIALAGCLVLNVGYAQRRPEPNAFLNRPIATAADLIRQASTDRTVMDRYMRHYGMDRDQVLALFRTFRMQRMQYDGTFQIYSVPDNGVIKVRTGPIRRGERVFVDQSDRPVMLVNCGNPLTLGPAQPVAAGPLAPVLVTEEVALRPMESTLEPAEAEERVYVSVLEPAVPAAPDPIAIVTEPLPPVIIETPTTAPAPFGRTDFGFLAGLPLLALAFSPGGGEPIPEPATMLALGTGVMAVLLRRKRRGLV
jgi:hypothetical protein